MQVLQRFFKNTCKNHVFSLNNLQKSKNPAEPQYLRKIVGKVR